MTAGESSFDTATRVAAGDDGTRYDAVSIALHWATALLVVIQFALAESWDWFAKPARELMEATHMSLGVVLTAVIAGRLVWRLIPGHQLESLEAGWVRIASRATHYLLYTMLAAEAVLGFAFRWGTGRPMSFFGLELASPIGEMSKPLRHLLRDFHNWNGWAIVILAGLHAAAALYHHYVVKDRVLVRMLPRGAL